VGIPKTMPGKIWCWKMGLGASGLGKMHQLGEELALSTRSQKNWTVLHFRFLN
jgi:hypothetical protein